MSSVPVRIEVRTARPRRLRIAEPRSYGRYRLHLDSGEIVEGVAAPQERYAEELSALEAMLDRAAPMTLGLLVLADGRRRLHWALVPGRAGLVPTSVAQWRARARKGALAWVLALVLSIALGAYSIAHLFDSVAWAFALALSPVGVVIAGIGVFERLQIVLDLWRHGTVLRASERALAAARAQPPAAPAAAASASALNMHALNVDAPDEHDHDEPGRAGEAIPRRPYCQPLPAGPSEPELLRVQARVRRLEVVEDAAGPSRSRLHFGRYRFGLGKYDCELAALRGGVVAPFLAEGDWVEAVIGPGREAGQPTLVYALHNHEDGEGYLAHGAFRVVHTERGMTRFTGRSYLRMSAGVGVLMLIAMGLVAAIDYGNSQVGQALVIAAALMGLCALGLLLPFAAAHLLWRSGRPSQRQALTSRVYAAMGWGPAWAWRLPSQVHAI